jgi:hypothetical protein
VGWGGARVPYVTEQQKNMDVYILMKIYGSVII